MKPLMTCIVTKIAAVFVVMVCLLLLNEGVTTVVNVTITPDPDAAIKNPGLREIMRQERSEAQRRLSDMEEIIAQNSDELPERTNPLNATEMCSKKNSCVPKFYPLETKIRVAPEFKMLICTVQKSMSTVMTALFCYLYDKSEYEKSERSFVSEWSRYRFCKNKNEYNAVRAAREDLSIYGENQTGWSFSMVTRDPVERFVSGFVDRCIRKPLGTKPCNGCGYNMTCFLERELGRIQEQVAARHLKRSFEDVHFFPQNWRCELHREYKQFEFLKYSSDNTAEFIADVMKLAARQNVSEDSINFLTEQLKTGKTIHVTADTPARLFMENRLRKSGAKHLSAAPPIRLRSSPYLMEHVVRMFYHDFILFNYDFPPGF